MDLMTDTAPDLATLERKVDVGFARNDEAHKRFDEALARMREDRAVAEARSIRMEERSNEIRAEMKAGFERADDKFERLHALLVKIGAGLIGTLIAAIASVVVTHL